MENIPTDKRILKEFMRCGYIERKQWLPTTEGSPQGGLCRARHNPPYDEINVMTR